MISIFSHRWCAVSAFLLRTMVTLMSVVVIPLWARGFALKLLVLSVGGVAVVSVCPMGRPRLTPLLGTVPGVVGRTRGLVMPTGWMLVGRNEVIVRRLVQRVRAGRLLSC